MLTKEEKVVASMVSGIFPGGVEFDFRGPVRYGSDEHVHVVVVGSGPWARAWVRMAALVCHFPNYERSRELRTRITWAALGREEADDFVYDHKELFDNCFSRFVAFRDGSVDVESFRPVYEGRRHDFVDVEFEFVSGNYTNPVFQRKLARWELDPCRQLTVIFCTPEPEKNLGLARRMLHRLPAGAPGIQALCYAPDGDADGGLRCFGSTDGVEACFSRMMDMAKYLNYFYAASYAMRHVPTELPADAVEEAWKTVTDPKLQLSNFYNVLTMASKMRTLGHPRDDWRTFYALTAAEIDEMTPTEHNRWSVERLMQGSRPCTDAERAEIGRDMSLKKKYKKERDAHFDLVAFDELGLDETGQHVARYDRDLIAAIPLIVKSFNDSGDGGL